MRNKKWKFITPKDRVVTTASTVAGLSLLGLGLSLVFNPVAIGIAAGYILVNEVAGTSTALRKYIVNRRVRRGKAVAVSGDEPISLIAAEISRQLGRPQPPEIHSIRGKGPNYIAAMPDTNTLYVSPALLRSGLEEPKLRFLVAHEMSHLQADKRTFGRMQQKIVPAVIGGLMLAGLVTLAAPLVGLSLPFLAGSISLFGLAALAAAPAATAAMRLNARIMERRADRNALYITRDLNGAEGALLRVDPTAIKRPSRWKELFLSHSSYRRRVADMGKDFEKVSRLPMLPGTSEILAAQREKFDADYARFVADMQQRTEYRRRSEARRHGLSNS